MSNHRKPIHPGETPVTLLLRRAAYALTQADLGLREAERGCECPECCAWVPGETMTVFEDGECFSDLARELSAKAEQLEGWAK